MDNLLYIKDSNLNLLISFLSNLTNLNGFYFVQSKTVTEENKTSFLSIEKSFYDFFSYFEKIKFLAFCLFFLAIISLWNACNLNNGLPKAGLPDKISYNFHVRPILSDKCFACHGPDKNKLQAGLRLDNAESAYAPLKETKGAFAIVPGKPSPSRCAALSPSARR